MAKKLLRSIIVVFALSLTIGVAYARMTDQQVIAYVQKATDDGKSQQDIARELMARGVTEAQLRRIKQRMDQQNKEDGQGGSSIDRTVNRNSAANTNLRGNTYTDDQMYPSRNRYSGSSTGNYNNNQKNSQTNSYNSNKNSNAGVNNKNNKTGNYNNQYNQYNQNGQSNRRIINGTEVVVDEQFYYDDMFVDDYWSQFDQRYNNQLDESKVYGVDLFRSRELTFEPNENLATPEDYRLGPGDEVIIDVWGNNEAQFRQSISPEGSIFVEQIGPIYLNGLTIK